MIATLKRRSEFLRIRGGARWSSAAFLLEAKVRSETDREPARFGFTVTRKLGNAVVRNRIRRRLREAVRKIAPLHAAPGTDYVLVARRPALDCAFANLERDLQTALRRVTKARLPATVRGPGPGT